MHLGRAPAAENAERRGEAQRKRNDVESARLRENCNLVVQRRNMMFSRSSMRPASSVRSVPSPRPLSVLSGTRLSGQSCLTRVAAAGLPGLESLTARICRRARPIPLDAQQPLYLHTRSSAPATPVLIWPEPVATARSAMNASSVSPEAVGDDRGQPVRWASSTAFQRLGQRADLVHLMSTVLLLRPWRCRSLMRSTLVDEIGRRPPVADHRPTLGQHHPSHPNRPRPCRPRWTRWGNRHTACDRRPPCPWHPGPCSRLPRCSFEFWRRIAHWRPRPGPDHVFARLGNRPW